MNKKKFSIIIVVITFVLIIIWVLYSLSEFNDEKNDYAPTDSDASEPNWIDHRFGIAGSGLLIDKMSIKYRVGWGHEFTETTIGNLFRGGREQVIYIGRLEHTPHDDLCADKVVHYNNGEPSCGGYRYIQQVAQRHPGKYWSIGNEPDFNPYMKPRDYAIWYHKFYEKIKQYDSTAKVSIGGNFFSMYGATSSSWSEFGTEYLSNDPLLLSLISQVESSNETQERKSEIKAMLRQNAWLVIFREYHKNEFGSYPGIDYWNVHNYPNRYYKQMQFTYNGELKTDPISDSKAQIDSILKYIDYIGDGKKPVWVTEFSVYNNEDCYTWDECNARAPLNLEFMNNMINYYVNNTNKRVTKWFWYTADSQVHNACSIVYSGDTINFIGANYLLLASSLKDISAPSVSSISLLNSETDSVKYVFEATANDVGNSGLEEYCYGIDTNTKDSPEKWICNPWVGETYKYVIMRSEVNNPASKKFFVRVKDSAGNFSTIISADFSLPCPQNLTFNCTDGIGVFTWDVVEGAVNYMIRINREPENDWANPAEGDRAESSVIGRFEAELQPNKNYVWWSVQGIKPGEIYPYPGCQTKYTTMFSCNPVPGGCTPSCAGKQCGSDGCSGICGTCAGGKTCDASGQCVEGQTPINIDIDGVAGVSMGDYSAFVLDYLAFRRRGEFKERSDFVKSTPNVINMADYQAFVLEYLRLRRL